MLQPINWLNLLKAPAGGFSSAEYQAVYDSWTNKPDASVANNQNTMVESWVDDGVWATREVQYLFAVHTNNDGEALTNWKNPGTYDATLVNAPVFTAFEGFKGNGTTSYIRLNFIPGTNGVSISQNDASFGAYIRDDIADSRIDIGGYDGTTRFIFYARSGTDTKLYSLNDNLSDSSPSLDSRGRWALSRDELANVDIFKNGGLDVTDPRASNGMTNIEIYMLAHNNNGSPGTFSAKQASEGFIGVSITPTEALADATALEAYMDSNGKGIIT